MHLEKAECRELCENIWTLSAGLRSQTLTYHSYLIKNSAGDYSLVDPGPARHGRAFISALPQAVQVKHISRVFLLDEDALAWSSLEQWQQAGLTARVFCDWRCALSLKDAGLSLSLEPLHHPWSETKPDDTSKLGSGAKPETKSEAKLELQTRVSGLEIGEFSVFLPELGSAMVLVHRPSGIVFSGALLSSSNSQLTGLSPQGNADQAKQNIAAIQRAQLRFQGLHPGVLDASALISCLNHKHQVTITRYCPRYGEGLAPILGENSPPHSGLTSSRQVVSLTMSGVESKAADSASPLKELTTEIEQLRSANLELNLAMILARDAAIRDSISGLYNRDYAEVFLRYLLESSGLFCLLFIELDRLKALNREIGGIHSDRLLADLAAFLLEQNKDSYLFRWGGPVFLLILERPKKEAIAHAEYLQQALTKDRRFSRQITISIALVDSLELRAKQDQAENKLSQQDSETQSDFAAQLRSLQNLARSRLKLAQRKGGSGMVWDSGLMVEEKALTLILDSDPISSAYLAEYLKRQQFSALAVTQGSEALALIDQYKPELLIIDAFFPQFNAFQLREYLLASNDLRHIPCILLCDGKTEKLIERAHALGLFHIFEKPVDLLELKGTIGYLLERSHE